MKVVIAGAGPVGLMLAAELRPHGVDVVVLEGEAEPARFSKAMAVHARTVDTFALRGLTAELSDCGRAPLQHFAGLRILDLSALPGAHPYALILPQARTEAMLARRAAAAGAEIRRGHAVVGIDDHGDAITVTVDGPAGRYDLAADHLVGCD